jgi:transposase
VRRDEVEALHAAGVDAVLAVIRGLEGRVEELERRVNRDSGNSSMPPSSDPPMTRQQRRALARERAKASLREAGGQPGHEGKTRELLGGERLDRRVDHLPWDCLCGHRFDGEEERLGEPVVDQKWELPPISRSAQARTAGAR